MKKQNIVFSGFMAAILFSAGAANAATQIASKQYVDNRETSILQTVSNTYETKENVTNLTEQVTQLGDTINNEDTGLAAKVDDAAAAAAEAKQTADTAQSTATGAQSAVEALGATVGNAESGLVKDVNDLETSVGGLQTTVGQLNTEMDSKLDSATAKTTYEVLSNKAAAINEGNQTSPTAYPSVGAIVQWTNKKIADLFDTGLPVNPGNINDGTISGSKLENGAVSTDKIANDAVTSDKIADDAVGSGQIADGAVGTDDIADGAVTSDKLDGTLAGQIADISGKQDIAMGVGHENHIVTTDASGNITSAATIGQDKVTGLTDALEAKASTADIPTAVSELTNDSGYLTDADMTGYAKTTDLDAKQNKNVGIENNGKILTVGADGNITTSATIAQSKVEGLETALADKAAADDLDNLDTRVGLAENDIDALQTTVGSSTDGLVADVAELQKTASALDTTYEQIANRTDTLDAATTASKYPTAGAVRSYVASEIAALDDTGLPVNPGNIEDGSLPGSKLQDGAITTDKIANSTILKEDLNSALQTEIDGKADLADVYTRQQTNDKIVEIAIQQPSNTCTTESDLCVLTLTHDNKLAWVPVTEPATAPVDAGPVMGSKNTDTTVD